MKLFWTIAFGALAACGESSRSSAVLDSLVPGARIGTLAAPAAQRLHLEFTPYVGYADSSHAAARGGRSVALLVEGLDAAEQRPSALARIKGVMLGFRSHQAADSMRERLSRTLGPPEITCYRPGYTPAQMELFYWRDRGSKGTLLWIPLQASREAFVTFGTMPPEQNSSFEGSTPGACTAG